MVRYGELDQALAAFVRVDANEVIPIEYYRRVIKISIKANNIGKQWDMHQAAAVLLYFVFSDGLLAPSQLTTDGLKALDHAEVFLRDTRMAEDPAEVQAKHNHSA